MNNDNFAFDQFFLKKKNKNFNQINIYKNKIEAVKSNKNLMQTKNMK